MRYALRNSVEEKGCEGKVILEALIANDEEDDFVLRRRGLDEGFAPTEINIAIKKM